MIIHSFSITKAQYGFVGDVEIIVKTRRQSTSEHHAFKTGGKNLFQTFWNIYFGAKKEAKRLQSLPGEYESN